MQILFLNSVDSTQKYLKELVKTKSVELPYAVVSKIQTDGIGSRDNSWNSLDGNLFLSFALSLEKLPDDLKLESSSIYFAYILKNILNDLNSDVWLKWPNDFYINDKKIGGMITNIVGDSIICGVGLNLVSKPEGFDSLDIDVKIDELVKIYLKKVEETSSWKQVFSKYQIEFEKNKKYYTHNKNLRISLEDVSLNKDGSINYNDERIYSLR